MQRHDPVAIANDIIIRTLLNDEYRCDFATTLWNTPELETLLGKLHGYWQVDIREIRCAAATYLKLPIERTTSDLGYYPSASARDRVVVEVDSALVPEWLTIITDSRAH